MYKSNNFSFTDFSNTKSTNIHHII